MALDAAAWRGEQAVAGTTAFLHVRRFDAARALARIYTAVIYEAHMYNRRSFDAGHCMTTRQHGSTILLDYSVDPPTKDTYSELGLRPCSGTVLESPNA